MDHKATITVTKMVGRAYGASQSYYICLFWDKFILIRKTMYTLCSTQLTLLLYSIILFILLFSESLLSNLSRENTNLFLSLYKGGHPTWRSRSRSRSRRVRQRDMDDLTACSKFCVVLSRMKPYILMVALQFGSAGMYIISMATLNHGMSRFVLIVYRNAVAAVTMAPFALLLERLSNVLNTIYINYSTYVN